MKIKTGMGHRIRIRAVILVVLALLLMLSAFSGCVDQSLTDPQNPADPVQVSTSAVQDTQPPESQNNDTTDEKIQIIHAAGEVRDEDGTVYYGANSYEGLELCYNAGHRYVEIDFNFTSDGTLACIHGWYKNFSEKITANVPLSRDEYMQCKIFGHFTPMCLDTLAEFLKEHPDLYIVTDIKDRNVDGARKIAETYPELVGQFIVQIYQKEEYEQVRELGFEHIILTLYKLSNDEMTDVPALVEFARNHQLFGITFAASLADLDGFVSGLSKNGIPLFVHTVNGEQTCQKYYDMGISGVYTDYRAGSENVPEEVR